MSGDTPARSALADLLGQTSVAEFATEVWSRRQFFRSADSGPDLAGLFTLDDADELLGSRALRTPFLRIAKDGVVAPRSSFTRSGGVGATVDDQVDADKVTALLLDGATVIFQGLHRAWPRLQRFSTALTVDLGHPVQANAYLTPAAARGFAAHYDTHDVFVVQLAGTKQWAVHEPVVDVDAGLADWTHDRAAVERAAAAAPVFERLLEPGDVAYLPRGWIHSAHAGAATSLHLTLGIHPYTERDVIDAVVEQAVQALRVERSLALGVDVSDPDAMAPVIEDVRVALSHALDGVKAEDISRRLAGRRGADVRPAAVRPAAQTAAIEELRAGGEVTVALRSGFTPRVEEHADGVTIDRDGSVLTFPHAAADAVRHIATGAPCGPEALPGLGAQPARDLLIALLGGGFVVPVSR